MQDHEADEVVTLIQAATRDTRVEQNTLDYFKFSLREMDYYQALDAAALGVVIWRRFPSWREFREFYKSRAPQPPPTARDEKPPKHPEWVWVWSWARNRRSPRNLRPFPQQREFADPDSVMTNEEYDVIYQEWLAAGSPKAQNPIVLARDSQIEK